MFGELIDKFDNIFRTLRGSGKLSEKNIKDSLREVRRALLEADVNYKVVKDFIANVETEAVGEKVLKAIEPGQQIVKIVHDQLVHLLGDKAEPMTPATKFPTIYMLCGLQGSGKTTLSGKLALQNKRKNKKVLLVAADIYRPAAVKQLKVLAESIGVEVFHLENTKPPVICDEAKKYCEKNFFDLMIIDTAGRLHIDEELMVELEDIKAKVVPDESILVADSMTGQDAVNLAEKFHERLQLTGVALTKLDGDARGGAAISIRAVTGCPIKLVSVGEKLADLELFHPDRMASRILGMGDIVGLVEKAQEAVDLKEAAKMEEKLKKQSFTLEDFYDQLQQIKKMGPLESILGMIPGMGKALKGVQIDEKGMVRVEAMIQSMTPEERRNPNIIDGSRKLRIASGSGNSVQNVNLLLKQFFAMQKMFKSMGKMKIKGLPKGAFPFQMNI
ncbi:Signal Recognition Particle (SRP) component with 4.5S RNA (ffs) [Candidatus Zixiibacteriota bacterium]|nr:Signal Recognition Particle (SRP) component with 4.5S RNA (ffs) [candidate division Zixibacteria bacterium]